jgi:hypothetical protein
MERASVIEREVPVMTAEHAGVEEPTAVLARRLTDRLARAGQHTHELRLAHARMLNVVELLESADTGP